MEFLVEQLKSAIEEKSEYKLKWRTLENHNKILLDKIEKLESEKAELIEKLDHFNHSKKDCLKVESFSESGPGDDNRNQKDEEQMNASMDTENSVIVNSKDYESWTWKDGVAQPAEEELAGPAIAYDKMERILAKDAAVYLRDPLMEAWHAVTEMPLRPKAGTLILFKSTEATKSEDWRAHGYRWKQCSGGKNVLQTLHYTTFNIVTPDHPLPRGTNLFTMQAYTDRERPHLTLLHFMGDHNVAVDFPHGNSKGMTSSYSGFNNIIKTICFVQVMISYF